MLFRSFDADTGRLLNAVYLRVLSDLADAGRAPSGERLAVMKTLVVRSLIEAAEAGERDPQRLTAYALGSLGDIRERYLPEETPGLIAAAPRRSA
jgi:hypothetical protein